MADMEKGAVPPPRRSAPRSLVSPPTPRDSLAVPGTSPHAFRESRELQSPLRVSNDEANIRQLREALEKERREREKYQSLYKDEVSKQERRMHQQSQLEEAVIGKDDIIESLSNELRILKQKKQLADSDLAQSTADYMNSQAKWLEQVDGLNEEIQALKSKLAHSQDELSIAKAEIAAHRERLANEAEEKRKNQLKAARADNVQVAADALEKHQNELLIKELRSYHNKLKDEIAGIKEMNERLKEDNEQYQYLLVERTVTGSLPAHQLGDSLSPVSSSPTIDSQPSSAETESDALTGPAGAGMTLADDEVLYDLKPIAKDPTLTDADSTISLESTESLQKTVARQQFDIRSLQNHNRALKLSLERLVDRLLDNKTFSKAVEESVSKVSVQKFRKRVASYTERQGSDAASVSGLNISMSGGPGGGGSSSSSGGSPHGSREASKTRSPSLTGKQSQLASLWSNMIFNAQYTGTPGRRVFSLGVDNEVKAPQPPSTPMLHPQNTGGMSNHSPTYSLDTASSMGNHFPFQVTPIRYAFGHPKSISPTACSLDLGGLRNNEIEVAKRTDSLTGMRKLRLAD